MVGRSMVDRDSINSPGGDSSSGNSTKPSRFRRREGRKEAPDTAQNRDAYTFCDKLDRAIWQRRLPVDCPVQLG